MVAQSSKRWLVERKTVDVGRRSSRSFDGRSFVGVT